jgi:6-phosphogluconolactonase
MPDPVLRVFPDPAALARAGVEEFVSRAGEALGRTGRFTVALSGGRTPKALYSLLAGRTPALPWEKIHFFFGDERCVPHDHPDSNYRMVREALFDPARIPAENIHAVQTELGGPTEVAADYEGAIRAFFRARAGSFPSLDLVFLGMGKDGHTASLFPGTPGLLEKERFVVPALVKALNSYRVTLTYPLLNAAAHVVFLVEGDDKAETLRAVFSKDGSFPVQGIKPTAGDVLWLLDEAAARALPRDAPGGRGSP